MIGRDAYPEIVRRQTAYERATLRWTLVVILIALLFVAVMCR